MESNQMESNQMDPSHLMSSRHRIENTHRVPSVAWEWHDDAEGIVALDLHVNLVAECLAAQVRAIILDVGGLAHTPSCITRGKCQDHGAAKELE